jgi:hypothetical protein
MPVINTGPKSFNRVIPLPHQFNLYNCFLTRLASMPHNSNNSLQSIVLQDRFKSLYARLRYTRHTSCSLVCGDENHLLPLLLYEKSYNVKGKISHPPARPPCRDRKYRTASPKQCLISSCLHLLLSSNGDRANYFGAKDVEERS